MGTPRGPTRPRLVHDRGRRRWLRDSARALRHARVREEPHRTRYPAAVGCRAAAAGAGSARAHSGREADPDRELDPGRRCARQWHRVWLVLVSQERHRDKRCAAGDATRERRDIADGGKTYTTIDRITGPLAAARLLAAVVVDIVSDSAPDKAAATRVRLQASAAPGIARLQLNGVF